MLAHWVKEWLLLFYIYCFFGWCFESTYVSLRTGHWVNRGFMKAPFLPLYGSGAMLLLIVSRSFSENIILTYIAGCIGATILEFVTGAGMEWLFKIKYWDYSRQRFNLKGHICLSSTIAWGFLTLFMTRIIHEPIEGVVRSLPEAVVTAVVLVLTIMLAGDFALSFKAAMDLRDVLIKLEEARADMEELQIRLRSMVEHAGAQVQRAIEERGAKLDALHHELTEIRENIQAELTAGFEVRISKLHKLAEENNLESLEEIKEEYRQWRSRFYENQHKRLQALDLSDKFKLHHLKNNPTMNSKRFKKAMEEMQEQLNKFRDAK